jgi:hypothetical protein
VDVVYKPVELILLHMEKEDLEAEVITMQTQVQDKVMVLV